MGHFLTPKPTTQGIDEGDIVERISGPFKGEKARVMRIDEGKEEVTVELFEAMVPIPVTVRGDHVRVLEKKASVVERIGREWALRDVESRNGTWVNGVRLRAGSSRALESGDLLSLGRSVLVFQVPSGPAPK